MAESSGDGPDDPRKQTDESLRAERKLTDSRLVVKAESVDETADEVVKLARERADELVQTTRNEADREGGAAGPVEQERAREDAILEQERADADAVVEFERAERKRYMADFLTAEREATDTDLIGERTHADTAVADRDERLATVSHDLRSLLAGLSLSGVLLVDAAPAGPEGELMRKHGLMSQRLVARMNRLVNDLLDVASIEAGRLTIFPEQVDVAELLRDTLAAFEPIAAKQRITLDAEVVAPGVRARLDGGRILQVLANLVSNAMKFTPAGGRVSLAARVERDELELSVRDTGIGIPAASLQSVFERFRQVNVDPRGLGLGLHIAKRIVEAHGGTIWVESQLAAGSTFHFRLPVGQINA
jgi:signal transduction histidine kinase